MPNLKTINGNSIYGSGDLTISGAAAWGSITGTLSSQTDLQTALNALVPYSGATSDVNLGARTIDAADFNGVALTAAGAGTSYLANDGTYKSVSGSGLTQPQVMARTLGC